MLSIIVNTLVCAPPWSKNEDGDDANGTESFRYTSAAAYMEGDHHQYYSGADGVDYSYCSPEASMDGDGDDDDDDDDSSYDYAPAA
ncbi:hypothetical protein PanWU01x14_030530 [Parasponia andersonii]|uniref:Uncharacterized protein n=1 Tax=Parasponia andersonii TaxID=3476 RepID=A0A2P5DUS7_PARAD|nr:hypothetical protein PanWU01x14_030530 [Parasponia andersonii]